MTPSFEVGRGKRTGVGTGVRRAVGDGFGRAPRLPPVDEMCGRHDSRSRVAQDGRCACTATGRCPGSGTTPGHRSQGGHRRRRAASADAWAASSALCAPRTCSAPDGGSREDKGCTATRPVQAFRHSGERSRAPPGHARGLGSRPNGGGAKETDRERQLPVVGRRRPGAQPIGRTRPFLALCACALRPPPCRPAHPGQSPPVGSPPGTRGPCGTRRRTHHAVRLTEGIAQHSPNPSSPVPLNAVAPQPRPLRAGVVAPRTALP
jgi:hypothetical protein